jgi:uncharacterized protein with HEPN domain
MPRDHRLYLDDILESIDRIFTYIEGMDYATFASDRKTIDAVIRNLEIIGEASKNVSEALQELTHNIEWKKIVGLRNILAHAYFGINQQMVWGIVQNKLQPLKKACEMLLKESLP